MRNVSRRRSPMTEHEPRRLDKLTIASTRSATKLHLPNSLDANGLTSGVNRTPTILVSDAKRVVIGALTQWCSSAVTMRS